MMIRNTLLAIALVPSLSFMMPTGYNVGDIVEDFNLQATDQNWYALDSFPTANGFIVIFTCNTCPYAQDNETRIMALHSKYEPLGYPVLAINPNDPLQKPGDSFEEMQARARHMKYQHPYLHDATQDVTRRFGASRTPQVYVLQKTPAGNVVKYIGAIDDSPRDENLITAKYAEHAVDALIAGEKPDPDFVKAIGCSIKWKLADR